LTNPLSDQAPVQLASYSERLAYIISLYKDGVAGNKQAVLEANQLLERLRRDYPDRPLAEAYHGGIMILVARDKSKPMEKLRWSKRGLKLLDHAVTAAPQDIVIRLLRGKAAYKLPEKYFRRTATAIKDYTFLLEHESELAKVTSPEEVLQMIDELGEAYYRIGRNKDAASCWSRLEQQTVSPHYQQLAKQKLQSVAGKPAVQVMNNQTNVSALPILIGFVTRVTSKAFKDWMMTEGEKLNAHRQEHRGRHSRTR